MDEFDFFIRMRVEMDSDPNEFFEIFKEKYQIENQMVKQENNDNNGNNFGDDFDLNGPPQFDNMSVQSDMMYSFENGMPSNEIEFTEQTQNNNRFIPKDRYEIESNISSFDTGGNGIFKETSFLVMDTELTGTSSIRDQINLKRTINKLKKIGDGSTLLTKTEGYFNFLNSFLLIFVVKEELKEDELKEQKLELRKKNMKKKRLITKELMDYFDWNKQGYKVDDVKYF